MNINQLHDHAIQEVLFVDDEEKTLQGIGRLQRQYGVHWNASYATGVDDAIDIINSRSVDAVISDIKMPGKNGFELLVYLRGRSDMQDLPVVMLTGLDGSNLKSKALELGATDLLNKPVKPEELIARIRSVLHLKSLQDRLKQQNAFLEELVRERTKVLEATRLDMIWRLGRAAEFRSSELGNHVVRIGYYAKILSETLGLQSTFHEMIFLTSPLHDLGKIGVPDAILLKPGQLTDEEWRVMQSHCHNGRVLLSSDSGPIGAETTILEASAWDILGRESNPFLQMAADIAGYHHEKYDGGGYPYGVGGNDIPLAAKIVTVCDVYDALRCKRVYKPAFSHDEAVKMMQQENGLRFDPVVFSAFEKCLEDFIEVRKKFPDS